MKWKNKLAGLKGPFILTVSLVYFGLLIFAIFNYRSHCIFTEPKSLIQLKHIEPSKAAQICKVDFDNLAAKQRFELIGYIIPRSEMMKPITSYNSHKLLLTVYGNVTDGVWNIHGHRVTLIIQWDSEKLVGGIANIDIFSEISFGEISRKHPHVRKGGQWKPSDCESFQKVAIVIPYRDRTHHLKLMLNRIHLLLWRQKIDYRLFVIEQAGRDRFNRGKLMNVGFKEALKVDNFDCFVFHDVDLLPENDKNLYMCDDNMRHLSSAIDETRYHVMYYNYAGGVIAMKTDNFRKINGYPNSYWGWGNEDDDISARIQEAGLLFTRPPEHIGRFKMVRHVKETRSENGYDAFLGWRGRWYKDGLYAEDTMRYNVTKITEFPLYTNVTVDIGPSEGHRINPALDTTKESLWWFLEFYFP